MEYRGREHGGVDVPRLINASELDKDSIVTQPSHSTNSPYTLHTQTLSDQLNYHRLADILHTVTSVVRTR